MTSTLRDRLAAVLGPGNDDLTTTRAETALEGRALDVDNLQHGAHPDCQIGRPAITAICGARLAWTDRVEPGTDETCVVCRDLDYCPVCGEVCPA